MGMPYGLLTYDIPITQRTIYMKLRKSIRRMAIPLNFSAYLIPWGARDTVKSILNQLHSLKPNVIASNVIKFDDSEQDALDIAAEKGLRLILSNACKAMNEKLQKSELEYKKAFQAIEDAKVSKKMDQAEVDGLIKFIDGTKESQVDKAIKTARRILDDATALAVTFNLTKQIDYAALEMQKMLDYQIKMADVAALSS